MTYECHRCSDFDACKYKHEGHIKNCGGIPAIFCKFQNQNLVTFGDNIK